jgi:uncharacterized protein (TIGR02996 family)
MAHNPFPDPAAVHPGEAAMLSAVLADLTDDLPKLVYADWLEERGDPRGLFLRQFVTAARDGTPLPPRGYGRGAPDLESWWVGHELYFTWDLAERGLMRFRERLLGLVKLAVGVVAIREPETHFPLGGTKFGGLPHLPVGSEWPRCSRGPLEFLAQFDLSDLRQFACCRHLPATGLLSVFLLHYNTFADGGEFSGEAVRIIHTPAATALEPLLWPDDLTDDLGQPREPCRLLLGECLDLPYQDGDPTTDAVYGSELLAEVDDPLRLLDGFRHEADHLLFGHSHPTVLAADPTPGPEWQQLFQFDSDDKLGWNWGDGHRLFWHVRTEDLIAGRFDRAVVRDG